MRLNDNEKYTHYGQVLQDMVRELDIFTFPTLYGDKHLYGHLRVDPMGLSNPRNWTCLVPTSWLLTKDGTRNKPPFPGGAVWDGGRLFETCYKYTVSRKYQGRQ